MVLLHNGNKIPYVPLAHAANMKESYESMKLLLGKIKYDEFKWKLCGDIKVVALLLGMLLGHTRFARLLRKSESSELLECCAGDVDFVQNYGMQYESENPLFGVPLGFFPRKYGRSQ